MALSVFILWTSEWIVMVASSALKAGFGDLCEFVCLYIVTEGVKCILHLLV